MKLKRKTILAGATIATACIVVWIIAGQSPKDRLRTSISEPQASGAPQRTIQSERSPSARPAPAVSTTITTEELLALARTLVPDGAESSLHWAESQSDELLRLRAVQAVIQAWGERDPAAAIAWALEQEETRRFSSMEAALTGAAVQPETALSLARDLLARDAESGNEYATILIGAFSRGQAFESALSLLKDTASQGQDSRAAAIFDAWGRTAPEAAVKALEQIDDGKVRAAAFNALVEGWATDNPGTLAEYAVKLPPGEQRIHSLEMAIDRWTLIDPAAMSSWLNQFADGPTFDFGAAVMVLQTDQANRDIGMGVAWMESIRDPDLRFVALEHLMQEWAASNRAAAESYVRNARRLTPEERDHVLRNLTPASYVIDD